MAPLRYATKFDLFLSLGCAGLERGGGAILRDQILRSGNLGKRSAEASKEKKVDVAPCMIAAMGLDGVKSEPHRDLEQRIVRLFYSSYNSSISSSSCSGSEAASSSSWSSRSVQHIKRKTRETVVHLEVSKG